MDDEQIEQGADNIQDNGIENKIASGAEQVGTKVADKAVDTAKEAGKKVAEEATKAAGKVAKEAGKKAAMAATHAVVHGVAALIAAIGPYLIPIIGAAAILFLAISALGTIIEIPAQIGDAFSSVASSITDMATFDASTGKYTISDEKLDELINNLKNEGINLEDYDLTKSDLKTFLEASLVAQTIDGLSVGDTNGAVKLYITDPNNETESLGAVPLTYISYSEFESELASANNSGSPTASIQNCYTIDSSNNILVATKTERSTSEDGEQVSSSVSYSSKSIAYEPLVSQYNIPFMLFIDMYMVSNNKDYVLELARQVKESQIIITIQKSVTETTSTYTDERVVEVSRALESTSGFEGSSVSGISDNLEILENSENQNITVVASQNMRKQLASNVNSISQNFSIRPVSQVTSRSIRLAAVVRPQDIDGGGPGTSGGTTGSGTGGSSSSSGSGTTGPGNGGGSTSSGGGSATSGSGGSSSESTGESTDSGSGSEESTEPDTTVVEVTVTEHSINDSLTPVVTKVDNFLYTKEMVYTNKKETTTSTSGETQITTTKNTYSPGIDKEVKVKVQEFVNTARSTNYKDGEAYNSLITGADLLFELLERDINNEIIDQTLKYIFYSTTGTSYGVTHLNESLFKSTGGFSSFDLSNGAIGYSSVQMTNQDLENLYLITAAERGDGNQEQQQYIASVVLNRALCKGISVTAVIEEHSGSTYQFSPAKDNYYKSDANRANVTSTTKAAVDYVIEHGDTTGGATYFCTPKAAHDNDWYRRSIADGTLIFLFNDENWCLPPDGNGTVNDREYSSTSNFYAFPPDQEKLNRYRQSGSSAILDVAARLFKVVATSGKFSGYGSCRVPCNGPNIDCSSFVSWVLYECGYEEFKGDQHRSYYFAGQSVKNDHPDWEVIPIARGEDITGKVQPGDIIARYDQSSGKGHVSIVAYMQNGRMYAYDCGSTAWKDTQGEALDKTYFLKDPATSTHIAR